MCLLYQRAHIIYLLYMIQEGQCPSIFSSEHSYMICMYPPPHMTRTSSSIQEGQCPSIFTTYLREVIRNQGKVTVGFVELQGSWREAPRKRVVFITYLREVIRNQEKVTIQSMTHVSSSSYDTCILKAMIQSTFENMCLLCQRAHLRKHPGVYIQEHVRNTVGTHLHAVSARSPLQAPLEQHLKSQCPM